MADTQGKGMLYKEAVASKEVTATNLQIMVDYAVDAKAASTGFITCKDSGGTTRKIMVQEA